MPSKAGKPEGSAMERTFMSSDKSPPFRTESVSPWSLGVAADLQLQAQEVVSWRKAHQPSWYGRPGRTLFLAGHNGTILKIKGAGFYNPPNTSFSGLKRTTSVLPTSEWPMPPLEVAFKRDLIHVDPAGQYPHEFEAVHSTFAPVGGMTLKAAMNDQSVFTALQLGNVPSNLPVAVFRYSDLRLGAEPMGVSVSVLPTAALRITPYEVYHGWLDGQVGPSDRNFLFTFTSGSDNGFDADRRLEIVSRLASHVGSMIARFSFDAGLYRFSGSPDNWNIKADPEQPLFFSDVDTSLSLNAIPPGKRPWEMLRNLLTALHQWTYFFLPALTYPESGYVRDVVNHAPYLRGIVAGFFCDASEESVDRTISQLSEILDPVYIAIGNEDRLGLRAGEYFLQGFYPRPAFYLLALATIAPLVERSELQARFPETDLTLSGIKAYILASAQNASHPKHFANFHPDKVLQRVDSLLSTAVPGPKVTSPCNPRVSCQN